MTIKLNINILDFENYGVFSDWIELREDFSLKLVI